MNTYLNTRFFYVLAIFALLIAINTTEAAKAASDIAAQASSKYVYIGTEFGISDPIIKKFKHKESSTIMRLKKSHMYGGKIGYSFYPNMMIELSGTHQPKHRIAYRLPETSLSSLVPGLSVPETPGITNVSANVFTANLVYEMEKVTPLEIKPYAIFGLGVAKVSIKPTISYWKAPAYLDIGTNVAYFKIQKTTQKCLAWQAGFGFSKNLAENFSVDVGAKVQVVHDIKIKYQTLDIKTKTFDNAEPIKKTIGVGEFTIGLTYKFPL